MPEKESEAGIFSFLPDLPENLDIYQHIEDAYINIRLPFVLEDYEQGKKLNFDILELSQEGVKQFWYTEGDYYINIEKEKLLPWEEIALFEMGEQYVSIKAKNSAESSDIWFKRECTSVFDMGMLRKVLAHIYI